MKSNVLARVMKFSFVILVLAVALPSAQTQSTFYVRAGAAGAGNGTDWSNAYPTLPEALVRGATYYVADGTYGGYSFDDANSGTSVITIKKASAADHGTSTGWTASYGDGRASFGVLVFKTNYYDFDGNTNSLGSYGFAVSGQTSSGAGNVHVGPNVEPSVDHIALRDLTINCMGTAAVRGIKTHKAAHLYVGNVEVWNCDDDPVILDGTTDTLLEQMYIHTRNSAGVGSHADAIVFWNVERATFRYSRVNWNGQQMFLSGANGTVHLYGNVFYGGPTSGKGVHTVSTNPIVGPVYIYNNTFTGLYTGMTLGGNTSGVVRNNIYHNIGSSSISFGGTSHDYNWFESGLSNSEPNSQTSSTTPFVNLSAADFRLTGSTRPGASLSSPLDMDPSGKPRGADGIWDRGAFEWVSGTTQPTAPAAPQSLRILR